MSNLKVETVLFNIETITKLSQEFNYAEYGIEETAKVFDDLMVKYQSLFGDKFVYFQHFIYEVLGAPFYEYFCGSEYNKQIDALVKLNTETNNLNLTDLIKLAATLELEDEDILNWYLATIQNMIGVKEGDFASGYFSCINWHLVTPEERVKDIQSYVSAEIKNLLGDEL